MCCELSFETEQTSLYIAKQIGLILNCNQISLNDLQNSNFETGDSMKNPNPSLIGPILTFTGVNTFSQHAEEFETFGLI
jgi:hypothetical protein